VFVLPIRPDWGTAMATAGIITAIIAGAVIGFLGRLVVPGKQNIPIWLTILGGTVAFVGTWIAGLFGVADTGGADSPPAPPSLRGLPPR
jgi:uncharacterized membrane protein YeaQ/YmgE (transglycosylase-associated protein family)